MTDELTLREKVLEVLTYEADSPAYIAERVMLTIASILEDTGSPAHMRVAAELRGLGDA